METFWNLIVGIVGIVIVVWVITTLWEQIVEKKNVAVAIFAGIVLLIAAMFFMRH